MMGQISPQHPSRDKSKELESTFDMKTHLSQETFGSSDV